MPVSLRHESVLALALRKQHLSAAAAGRDPLRVADDLLGLHATDRMSPYLQLRARLREFDPAVLDAALDEGRAARIAGMRTTLFIESAELVPLVVAATRGLLARGHDRWLAANGLTRARYEELAASIESALTGAALDAAGLRKAIGASQQLTAVLVVMCDEARLVRWRGRRGWGPSPPSYRRFAEALPGLRLDAWDEQAAIRELVRRYVARYGPVTEDDVAWWTGLSKTTVRGALGALDGIVRARIDGLEGEHLVDERDLAAARRAQPPSADDVSLLPLLDPYVQGYRRRGRVLDERHRPFVVDPAGNATSVVLVGGRVAGVWDQRTPELRFLLFDAPPAAVRRRVRAAASEVAAFLGRDPADVAEVERMTALGERSAGGVMSPLKEAG